MLQIIWNGGNSNLSLINTFTIFKTDYIFIVLIWIKSNNNLFTFINSNFLFNNS